MQKITLRLCWSSVLRNLWKYWHICNALSFPPKLWGSLGINKNEVALFSWGNFDPFPSFSSIFMSVPSGTLKPFPTEVQVRGVVSMTGHDRPTPAFIFSPENFRRPDLPNGTPVSVKAKRVDECDQLILMTFLSGSIRETSLSKKTVSYLKIQRSFIIFPTKILIWIHLEYTSISMQTHIYIIYYILYIIYI